MAFQLIGQARQGRGFFIQRPRNHRRLFLKCRPIPLELGELFGDLPEVLLRIVLALLRRLHRPFGRHQLILDALALLRKAVELLALFRQLILRLGQIARGVIQPELRILALLVQIRELFAVRVIFLQRVSEPQLVQSPDVFLIVARLSRLYLYAAQPLLDFFDDVVHAQQVLVHLLQLALRLFLPLFEFRDPCRLFEDQPALFGVCFQQRGDAPLLDHAVRIDADARIQKQFANVF